MSLLQFFSVTLIHFSDQNLNSQYLFSLHIIASHHCGTCAHQKKPFLIYLNKLQMLWYIQMIVYNYLLFPTLSIAYVMLTKMYYNGSLLNSLTPTTFMH